MANQKKIAVAIVLITAVIAAAGLLVGFLEVQPAVGLTVVGIVIGTGVARGAFSSTSDAKKRNS